MDDYRLAVLFSVFVLKPLTGWENKINRSRSCGWSWKKIADIYDVSPLTVGIKPFLDAWKIFFDFKGKTKPNGL